MTHDVIAPPDQPVETKLHPLLYRTMVALALVLVGAVWSLARTPDTNFLLVVVSGFVFFTVLIPATLWWTWRRHRAPRVGEDQSFRSWISKDFDMWQGRTSGVDATVEILLPPAAVAFGMTLFAILEHFIV